jgi:TetR/AcrR family transcriptional regulator
MKPVTRQRGRPARTDSAMSRAHIVRQAFNAFAVQGYDGVSLRQIAAACGVSDSLLHHHFGSKQELWREATDSVIGPLMQRLYVTLDELARQGDAATTIRRNLPESLKLVLAEPGAVEFLFREGEACNERGEYMRATYMRPYLQRLEVLFNQAVAEGRFNPFPPVYRDVLVMGFLRSLVIPGVLQKELAPHLATAESTARFIDRMVEVLFDGFARRPLADAPEI